MSRLPGRSPFTLNGMTTTDATALETHFAFGANWRRFLKRVDTSRVEAATTSLRRLLGLAETRRLDGQTFLDAGCGSGLFSLAAHRLGASVVGFDFDPQSVACSQELQRRFATPGVWPITEGSVLDRDFLARLVTEHGPFDIVYSWGVLHHTGAIWDAVDAVSGCVADGGDLAIALYNEQGRASARWRGIKAAYQKLPAALQTPYVAAIGAGYFGWRAAGKLADTLASPIEIARDDAIARRNALAEAVTRVDARGMSRWNDLVDWVGGWPYETATPGEVVTFTNARGFSLKRQFTVAGNHGCNEFVFTKTGDASAASPDRLHA